MTINWRQFWLMLAGYLCFESLSFATYTHPSWRATVFLAVVVGGLLVSWRRPAWAGYLVLLELIVGGKGYLLGWPVGGQLVSVRIGLFLVLMVVAGKAWWAKRRSFGRGYPRWLWWPSALAGWVIVSTLWGVSQHYPLGRVYTDVNAFLFLAVLPAWWIVWRDQPWRNHVVTIVSAGVTLVALKSWLIVALFTHDHTWLPTVYRWIRNTGVGEIMPMGNNLYRVFFQSQVYGVIALWFLVYQWYVTDRPRWLLMIPSSAAMLAIMISLSRSFWVGTAVGIGVFAIVSWRAWRRWWRIWPIGLAFLCTWFFYSWAVHFPNPLPRLGAPSASTAVTARLHASGSADAATARSNQIQPLLSEIRHNPIIGRGFGAEARYYSTDPRVRGWRTTSAFELGYLDWWLKMGLVGLALLAGWLVSIIRRLPKETRVWGIASLAAVSTVHLFTPYLNHPLGLGWLLFLTLLGM